MTNKACFVDKHGVLRWQTWRASLTNMACFVWSRAADYGRSEQTKKPSSLWSGTKWCLPSGKRSLICVSQLYLITSCSDRGQPVQRKPRCNLPSGCCRCPGSPSSQRERALSLNQQTVHQSACGPACRSCRSWQDLQPCCRGEACGLYRSAIDFTCKSKQHDVSRWATNRRRMSNSLRPPDLSQTSAHEQSNCPFP